MKPKIPARIKIISMGDTFSGKSCLIKRYYEKRFVPKYLPTIGIDYGVTKVDVDQMEVIMNIFDFSGDPIFFEVRNDFYKDTQGAMLVFDVTSRGSFKSLESWVSEMYNEMGSAEFSRVVVVVCANKVDKDRRVVDREEGRRWAELHSFPYFETSAKADVGVQNMIWKLLRNVLRSHDLFVRPRSSYSPVVTHNTSHVHSTPTKQGVSAQKPKNDVTEAVQRLLVGRDNYEKLGVARNTTAEEVNRVYRRLAVLLHPDKTVEPGAEEAFKMLVAAKTSVLRYIQVKEASL